MRFDYIICGHGIAGAVLAQTLLKKGSSVLVFEGKLAHSASSAAAGMWNPVSFKNLKLTWMANEFLEEAKSFYQTIEVQTSRSFFHTKELARLLNSTADINEWDTRSTSESLSGHIYSDKVNKLPSTVKQPFGYGVVKQCGWLNIPEFLEASKDILQDNIREECMDYSQIQIKENEIQYGEIQAGRIIFCEGYRIVSNPWFKYLPVEPNKGQVQTLHGDIETDERILHFGKFLLPLGSNLFRYGATYEFNDPNPDLTSESSKIMQEELKNVCTTHFQIVDEKTGYRPTLPDRKPLLGLHPKENKLAVFNGMGSRGVIMAPLCAKHFEGFLHGENPLDPSMNIKRYHRFFSET
jgi:glycine oxidase